MKTKTKECARCYNFQHSNGLQRYVTFEKRKVGHGCIFLFVLDKVGVSFDLIMLVQTIIDGESNGQGGLGKHSMRQPSSLGFIILVVLVVWEGEPYQQRYFFMKMQCSF